MMPAPIAEVVATVVAIAVAVAVVAEVTTVVAEAEEAVAAMTVAEEAVVLAGEEGDSSKIIDRVTLSQPVNCKDINPVERVRLTGFV